MPLLLLFPFPRSEVTLTDKSITLMLVPQSEIDPHDITTVVNNGHYRNEIDYTDSRFKERYAALFL